MLAATHPAPSATTHPSRTQETACATTAEYRLQASCGGVVKQGFCANGGNGASAPGFCVGDGSIVIALHSGGPLLLDMVFLQPAAEARYKGLPVRKDLADFLLGSGMTGMRMGGGTSESIRQAA